MIDVSNLKDALKTLGFVAYGDIYEKVFFEIGCSLKVDFKAKRLIYPNEIKGRERNDGFDQKENFVVFECVCFDDNPSHEKALRRGVVVPKGIQH